MKSSKFKPGIPASVAGVVPKSKGSTLTLYLKAAKADVKHGRVAQRVVKAERETLVAHLRRAAERHEFLTATRPESLWAIACEVGEAVSAEHVEARR